MIEVLFWTIIPAIWCIGVVAELVFDTCSAARGHMRTGHWDW